jgi:hypothetical protein
MFLIYNLRSECNISLFLSNILYRKVYFFNLWSGVICYLSSGPVCDRKHKSLQENHRQIAVETKHKNYIEINFIY